MVENDKSKRTIKSIDDIEIDYDKLYGRGKIILIIQLN